MFSVGQRSHKHYLKAPGFPSAEIFGPKSGCGVLEASSIMGFPTEGLGWCVTGTGGSGAAEPSPSLALHHLLLCNMSPRL